MAANELPTPRRLWLLLFLTAACGNGEEPGRSTVTVIRGSVTREAVALGRIEPRVEIPVKSPNGGVLTRSFVTLGQSVAENDPLVEVRPLLTDRQKLQAERALLGASEAAENARELRAGESMMGKALLMFQGSNQVNRMKAAGDRAKQDAAAQLELLLNGKAVVEGKEIDFFVRSPVAGRVIELPMEIGEPIVPSSSFGSGTVLAHVADMDHPIFRGTVDEIDVGRLKTGMRASLAVGALPGTVLSGELIEISLRAETRNNAVVFAVEIAVEPPPDLVLRAGYSAVARIVVERADDVLVLPERMIDVRGGEVWVSIDDGAGGVREERIETGLSNGLSVEVTAGLAEGDEVLERS
ncbi:MAG: efflux RND transporter periplasmic adaptor subunit [bacterium]|nr:efflux RND transporter periplasmic adaptor subunit [bacterium]